MKIAIIGYGKMGHAIERVALSRGHEIVATIDVDNCDDIESEAFRQADIAIEFTTPATAEDNCLRAFRSGVGVVCGSTGWADSRLDEARAEARRLGVSFMWSSNYSLGVNIFFRINSELAAMMARLDQYKPSVSETHHVHKLDHPSGTAVTLAKEIVAKSEGRLTAWSETERGDEIVAVESERRGEVPGIHTIEWDSPVDTITITHSAKSRDGFALGAVIAAEWVVANPGVHTIDELLEALVSNA